jgi:hypothetical protein
VQIVLLTLAISANPCCHRCCCCCADAGWDLDKHTLEPELQRLVLAYGEMAQATYDNLGMDRCQQTFGYSVQGPTGMLEHLTGEYQLAPGATSLQVHGALAAGRS